MTPSRFLMDLWPQVHAIHPGLKFQMVNFDNTPENAREILGNLGQSIDLVAGIFDETLLALRSCDALELMRVPICCAVSIYHPLLKILPVERNHSISFGLLHSPAPSPMVKTLIRTVAEILETQRKNDCRRT